VLGRIVPGPKASRHTTYVVPSAARGRQWLQTLSSAYASPKPRTIFQSFSPKFDEYRYWRKDSVSVHVVK